MRNVFFYTVTTTFVVGVFARSFFESVGTLSLLCLILGSAYFILWKRRVRPYVSRLFVGSIAFCAFGLGGLYLDWHERSSSLLESEVGVEGVYVGVVIREPDIRETSAHLYVRLSDYDETVLVIANRFVGVSYGDTLSLSGHIEKPEAFETDLGRMFNYPGYLKARGVHYTMPFADLAVLDSGGGNAIISGLFSLKQRIMQAVERSIPEPQAGLGEGLLLGVKRALGDDLEKAFRTVGIIHIVVLSGYNIMLVADAITRLLSFFLRPHTRMVFGILGISAFALIVGLSATVVRASVMAALLLIARATGRTYVILRALVLAGVGMVLINPYLLAFDPGFQLSFMATLGLIVLAPLIEQRLHLVPTKFQIREFLTATITTQLFVLPLLMYQIGAVSIIAIVVNVLVLPAVPLAMLLTFAAGVVGSFSSGIALMVGLFAYLPLTYIVHIAEKFALIPGAAVTIPEIPFVIVLFLYALMGYGIYRWRTTMLEHSLMNKEKDLDGTTGTHLDGWTIVEEKENSPDTNVVLEPSSLPFR
ncbi:ComEC/Rec2 family competence protein [Candidatus Kaiserbacteria bacterium]|nr:ComEC/Rec2 family competence protein [Candidatus Kaiserbacteria bacterium]